LNYFGFFRLLSDLICRQPGCHAKNVRYVIVLVDLPPRALVLCLLAAGCFAQTQAPSSPTTPPAVAAPVPDQTPGSIQGSVLSGSTGQPLRRAQVLLHPADSKGTALYQTTDENGAFAFPKVAPGGYTITVERDGYLPLSAGRIGNYKMPPIFSVSSGQVISSFIYRLEPSAVLSGKVKFDDAEPASNVAIQLYRSYYERGRHGFAAAASTHTDDRGEYRVHGLDPGVYYVAALYQAPARPANAQPETRKDAAGNPVTELNYAITFFPQVQKMSDAAPVRIAPGDEISGIDIFLTLVHTVHIRGRVSSAKGGVVAGPSVTLRMNDADNTASVSAPVNVIFDKDRNFDIDGVTAGPYLLMASGTDEGVALTGRLAINIGDADVSNADLVIGPEGHWTGKIHINDDDNPLPQGLIISLQPRRATAAPSRVEVSPAGDFSIPFVPDEIYDLNVLNAPEDAYIASVRVNNSERLGQGLEAAPGDAEPPLDVRLSTQGGEIVGRAVTADPSVVASGATVALLPDSPVGRVQAYQTTHADEQGNFLLRGVPPGKYVLIAWLDSPPCDVYNPDELPVCQARGISLTVDEGSQQSMLLTAN
jgi:Carboxypeptidase regulatory-like domain